VTTTTAIDGRPVTEYVSVVTGEAVLGVNVTRDLFAGVRKNRRSRTISSRVTRPSGRLAVMVLLLAPAVLAKLAVRTGLLPATDVSL
jgi:putative heavy-metal-binding protein